MDTNALLWWWAGADAIGSSSRHRIDESFELGQLGVSAISFWEVALLQSRRRIDLPEDIGTWRRELLGQGIREIPVDGDVGIRAVRLPDFHADPANRIIVATAQAGHTLITADRQILEWNGTLRRMNARL